MSPTIIAVCNQKGGVGKTTSVFHLARAAVLAGLNVLVVDLDPQGSISSVAAQTPPQPGSLGIADALSSHTAETLTDVIVPGLWPYPADPGGTTEHERSGDPQATGTMDIAPTTGEGTLAAVRDELVIAGAGREARLRGALADHAKPYDLVLIDCAPAIDLLTINGLTASHKALIITEAGLFATNGIGQLLNTIDEVRAYYNPTLGVQGVVVNKFLRRTINGQHWLDGLQTLLGTRNVTMFEPPIPHRAFIADSAEAATPIDRWRHPESEQLSEQYRTIINAITTK